MTIESFLHSTDVGENEPLEIFDELMMLYHLLNSRYEGRIGSVVRVQDESSYDVCCTDTETASDLSSTYDGLHIRLYNRYYYIKCESTDTIVRINLTE